MTDPVEAGMIHQLGVSPPFVHGTVQPFFRIRCQIEYIPDIRL